MHSSFLSEDRGQISLEQILLLSSIVMGMLVLGYLVKTQLKNLFAEQKVVANETFNKSI